MKITKTVSLLIALFALLSVGCFVSCSNGGTRYVIGVSQCSDDSWRTKLQTELEMATYFNEGVTLRFASANDDNNVQIRQIDSLVNSGIDLLIVSPNQVNSVSDAIDRAMDKKIPVILYDRKTDSQKFTAFMGADNFLIGEMLGEYIAGQLGGRGNIVEICGLKGSSPAIERHNGFLHAIERYPDLHIVATATGDWKEKSGEQAMMQILAEGHTDFDAVFGANDRMAVGARHAIEQFASVHQEVKMRNPSSILYIGVDALPTKGKGIEQVNDGILTASAIYPTHGTELLEMAIDILEGRPYDKVNMMQTSIVTSANAKVLLLQYQEVIDRGEYLKKMHQRVDTMLTELGTERLLLIFIIVFTVVVCSLLVFAMRAYRAKHELNEELHKRNKELSQEKEIAERQRDELEEQRDKLIEVTMHQHPALSVKVEKASGDTPAEDDVLTGDEQVYKQESEFMQKFNKCVEKHLSDSDLSVEDLGSDMCLSRVQLYRKVKALTGKSPVEIIRETRLLRASQLLADSSLTISEIAYRVGFSSPSYFTKCYRDMFGKSPTEVQSRANS